MNKSNRIRKMEISDIEQVLELEHLCFPTPWSKSAFVAELEDNLFARYLVAQQDGQVVGYGGMWLILNEAHITNIAVHPLYRGQGIGRKITGSLILEAVRNGADQVTLEVRVTNLIAQNLYKSLGFNEVGVRKGYYSDNNEDALIMWKSMSIDDDLMGGE